MKTKLKQVGACMCLSALLFVSCADGLDDSERFNGGVKNSQLESPDIDESCFFSMTNTDGSESVKITWPLVYGAGGYLLNVNIVDDPLNPTMVMKDSIVDGCSVVIKKLEDTKYEISVKTLGNPKLNNKEALEASLYNYSTLIPATIIPGGEDVASFIKSNLIESDKEQAFELLGGTAYTLNEVVDFGLNTITLRGDKTNRPVVKVGADGGFMTQGGLKIKFINIDCTDMSQIGVLNLSDTPSESISTSSLGYIAAGANQNGYVIEQPVIFQECNFRNVKNSVLYGNKKNWSLRDFRIVDCIVQLNNSGSNPVINLAGGSNGLIKNLTINKSTFYNLCDNGSAYFIRYSNSSNAQPKKIFGDAENSSVFSVSKNTFSKTFNGKDFANNLANTNTLVFDVHHNIFYDVYRLNKLLSSQGKMYTEGNTIFGVKMSVDSNDVNKKDALGNPYAILEDPEFAGPVDAEFDLELPYGGVDFRTVAPVATQYNSGDPRWNEEL